MKKYIESSHLLLIGFLFFCGCQFSNTDTKSPNHIGYIQPVKSTEIEDSYWGIQAGSLRDDILQKASELGVAADMMVMRLERKIIAPKRHIKKENPTASKI